MIFSSRARTAHGCPSGTVRSWFAVTRSDASNHPAPLAPAEMRPVFEHPVPFGGQKLRLLPPWDAGSDAYGYEFGKLISNPIGNNIVACRPVSQPFSMMTGSQANGAIFFTQQTINGGAQPELGQLYDPKVLQALLEYQQQNGV
jgi:hypothetical protein